MIRKWGDCFEVAHATKKKLVPWLSIAVQSMYLYTVTLHCSIAQESLLTGTKLAFTCVKNVPWACTYTPPVTSTSVPTGYV
jgi:hypothetical protein